MTRLKSETWILNWAGSKNYNENNKIHLPVFMVILSINKLPMTCSIHHLFRQRKLNIADGKADRIGDKISITNNSAGKV